MTERGWKPLEGVDRECFACGVMNPHGLKMTFESNEEMLRSRLTVAPQFRGWSSLVHGGILSTLLDEIMSWAAIHLTKRFILTKGMTVSFRRPVFIETPLTVTGFIKERLGDRKALVVGEIRDESGELCATSEGEFVLFTLEEFRAKGVMPEEELKAMARSVKGMEA
ncbi:MAG: PaaI family thioesterase [Desulfobacterales bacterium]|nr:PaaI family thioesterase [Desulfobacterales bacterium]